MAASNALVASALRQYAATLALEGADRFKTKAYRRAADTVDQLSGDLSAMVANGSDLTLLPGIGKAIASVITELIQTSKLQALDRAVQSLSPELAELAGRPGLDAKRVQRVYKKLGINSLAELKEALEKGKLRDVVDRRTEFHIRQGLSDDRRILLWEADKITKPIIAYLEAMPGVEEVSTTGSLRRREETVGDLNFLIRTRTPAAVFKRFEKFGGLKRVQTDHKRSARFELSTGAAVTLTAAGREDWGSALFRTTGSPEHVREIAAGATKQRRRIGKFKNEESLYEAVGLSFIPPELREATGEIEAAARAQLPMLVELSDLRGDLHMHTTESDGANSLEEMAQAAKRRGYAYIAITDHSQSLKITNGLTPRRLLARNKVIDRFNEAQKDFTVLKSAEVDILEDGSLDYSQSTLKQLDLTICSIHSRFGLNEQQQTDRLLRAIDNPCFTILGHATGRLLLKREGYEIHIEKVLRRIAENGKFVEINSSPDRLDLSAENARMAKELGIKVAVNTDAHSVRELGFITAGLNQARRAWLERSDVLNTLDVAALRRAIQR